MKRIWIIALLVAAGSGSATGQQLFRRSQFMLNSYLLNPAEAGTKTYSPIMASYRNQWAGFDAAPRTITVSGHTALPNRIGVGGIFFRDDTGGAIRRTGVELTGSYHIDLNNQDAVSFGLSGVLSQYSFDNDVLEVFDAGDQALQGGMEQNLTVDANFGLMVYGTNYQFGFAFPNIVQSSLRLENQVSGDDNNNRRHYYFMANYRYPITDDLTLSPMGLIKFTGSSPAQFDVHARLSYLESIWGGLTYRHKDAVAFMFGVQFGPAVVGYAYDITVTDARNFSPHTHELTLGYLIQGARGSFRSQSLGPRILSRKRIIN